MNRYAHRLTRIEFVVTLACTGRCRHCSEGDHVSEGRYIDGDTAARAVRQLCSVYPIDSLMTFGGEPLLRLDEVCRIHATGQEAGIPERQLITNGFFSRDERRIHDAVARLVQSGVNDILLSVDAFHQESIPLGPVKCFAREVQRTGTRIHANPAWVAGRNADNPYDKRTREILKEFEETGIAVSTGNLIFPEGNALKYLKEYFEPGREYVNPYAENPEDIRSVCVSPDGGVLGGNLYENDILNIIESYSPVG